MSSRQNRPISVAVLPCHKNSENYKSLLWFLEQKSKQCEDVRVKTRAYCRNSLKLFFLLWSLIVILWCFNPRFSFKTWNLTKNNLMIKVLWAETHNEAKSECSARTFSFKKVLESSFENDVTILTIFFLQRHRLKRRLSCRRKKGSLLWLNKN